jgi:hypothetical protein
MSRHLTVLAVIAALGCTPAQSTDTTPPVGEWRVPPGRRKPWADRPGKRGPLSPNVPGDPRLTVSFQGFFARVAVIHADGSVFWPRCDAREGWISRVDAARVTAEFETLRSRIASGGLPEQRRLTREHYCQDDMLFDFSFVNQGRTYRWSWTACETETSEDAKSLDRQLFRLVELTGTNPCSIP